MPAKSGFAAFRAALRDGASRQLIEATVFVAQGRCRRIAQEPVGTFGMGPCVGLAVDCGADTWLVAHIDCPGEIFESQKDVQHAVADWVAHRLTELDVAPTAERIIVSTPTNSVTTRAIIAGIEEFFGADRVTRKNDDGFLISQNTYYPVRDTQGLAAPDPTLGSQFSIPANLIRARAPAAASSASAKPENSDEKE